MPLRSYGVLKGRPIHKVLGTGKNPHYQIHMIDDTADYRIAVNVKSQEHPSEVEYLMDMTFQHPVIEPLAELSLGFHRLNSKPGGMALNFIRGNLLDRSKMRALPFNVPGPDNDLNEEVDRVVARAISEEDAVLYAFGERWGPEQGKKDKIFGFAPGNGVHDIHMNQGNVQRFIKDDGVWQDGALLAHFPSNDQWVAVFLKFQSQTWHTDDATGHRIEPIGDPGVVVPPPSPPGVPPVRPGEGDFRVRIVAAAVNPPGPAPEHETVTLINTTPRPINLGGWSIANTQKSKFPLTGEIKPGQCMTFTLSQQVPLTNKGGIITLLDGGGLKVHGVSYTADQASREGFTVVF
jgi:uncharacterized protein YukJ